MRTPTATVLALLVALAGCGEGPSGDPGGPSGPAATLDVDSGGEVDVDAKLASFGYDVVPVLAAHGTLDGRGGIGMRDLSWQLAPADDVPMLMAGASSSRRDGTATLYDGDGEVLAEVPVEVNQTIAGCLPDVDCDFDPSVSAMLPVHERAGDAHRLVVEVDDDAGAWSGTVGPADGEVERDGDVAFERFDAPEPDTVLDGGARIAWQATSGEVEARWLAGDGHISAHGLEGSAGIGDVLLPEGGGWLALVVSDGLAFDVEVAGPYLADADRGASEPEWRIHVDGMAAEEAELIEIPGLRSHWHARVNVLLITADDDGGLVEVDGRWTSDRHGDLNDQDHSFPNLRLNPRDLEAGEHTFTLHLEDRDSGETHQQDFDVLVRR